MNQQMPSPHSEEQPTQKKDSSKKLHKREQRILERLEEAKAAQAKALERFQRAEARLQKRMQRVQRAEGRLELIRQQMSARSQEAPTSPSEDTTEPDTDREEDKAAEQAETEQQSSASGPGTAESQPSQETVDEGQAPSVDEVVQEPSTGDVFMDEILLVDAAEHVALPSADIGDVQERTAEEAEAAAPQGSNVKSPHRAQEARAAAEAAEENARRAVERSAEAEARMEQMGSGRHLMQELLEMQAEADRASAIAQEAERAAEEVEQEESVQPEQDAPITRADDIAEIEEEEELVETLAATTFAEIAAERAASAEAIAEASSVHTREVRRRMHVAELALGQVRLAIRNGTLSGEEAEVALQNAEDELTRASAFLADAEATEEQALNNAMNAEAEAEVAEGMAYAAEQELEDRQQEPSPDILLSEDAPADGDDDESGSTQKLPIVHPPEYQ